MSSEVVCDVAGCPLEPALLFTIVESRSLQCEKFFCEDHARSFLQELRSKDAIGIELPKLSAVATAVELELIAYYRHNVDQPACIYLREARSTRRICILIDQFAWSAIIAQLRPGYIGSPLTHNSWVDSLKLLNADIVDVILDRKSPANEWWSATLDLQHHEGATQLNVRPSDAIILALISARPVFVTKSAIEAFAI